MKTFFAPNISRSGRWVRAVLAVLLLAGGFIAVRHLVWLGVMLFISSAVGFIEAVRGWCFLRACGIKTKL